MGQLTLLQRTRRFFYNPVFIFVLLANAFAPQCAIGGPKAVSAVGFVEPQGGIINLSGSSSSTGAIISELRVGEGDRVEAGQILAVLDSYSVLQAAVKQAEALLGVSQANLNLVQAGASEGTINAQQARIKSLQLQLNAADTQCRRAETLRSQGIVSQLGSEDACLNKQVLEGRLREAKATLTVLAEVRNVDVAVAQAELKRAEAALAQAQVELEQATLRSPVAGRVLRLYAKVGERIGTQGLLQLGQTDRMWIRAEVYETDIHKVQVGQQATITSDVFSGELHGTVEGIGLLIGKNQINTMMSDSRVVEVKIKLSAQDSSIVSNLTNLQVSVIITTEE
ncbi:MAG: HlyD family efflux transporter periplasmic adaptor subunit [bacterium]|nr:HlyD family efflux transporter periplasmic adaptor subunit [bacterium]